MLATTIIEIDLRRKWLNKPLRGTGGRGALVGALRPFLRE
jgi:hypothetical protein